MRYLLVFLLMGMLVSCGNDASGDETEVPKKVRKTETAKQPNCKDIKGLNYNEIAFKGVSKDYLGFVYNCYDGKVIEISHYKDGKRNGMYREWYKNGQLRYEVNFKDGIISTEKSWDEKGRVSNTEPYSIMSYSHMMGAHNLRVFDDYNKGLAYAKIKQKPVLLDFNGHACVNSRKMESFVWGTEGVIDILKDDLVIISLFVDDRTELPIDEQKMISDDKGRISKLTTYGQKWSNLQVSRYKANYQPYYRMLNPDGEDLSSESADYERHKTPQKFLNWLEKGLTTYRSRLNTKSLKE